GGWLVQEGTGRGGGGRHSAALFCSGRHEGGGAPSGCPLHRGISILPMSALGHFRQIGIVPPVTACPLRSKSGQTRACFAMSALCGQCQRDCHHLAARAVSPGITATSQI